MVQISTVPMIKRRLTRPAPRGAAFLRATRTGVCFFPARADVPPGLGGDSGRRYLSEVAGSALDAL